MAESVSWRDQAQRFVELGVACGDSLQAAWMVAGNGASDYQWRLQGASEPARTTFLWLASRAEAQLAQEEGTDGSYWLDLLKRDSPNHRDISLQQCDSNGEGVKTKGGIILRLCGASVQYCIRCEARMISRLGRKDEAEATPAAGVTQISSLIMGESRSGRAKSGPKVDIQRALRIAEIVAKNSHGGKWQNRVDDLCEGLDAAQITVPRAWREARVWNWSDCEDRTRVVKAITYQLKVAKKNTVILA